MPRKFTEEELERGRTIPALASAVKEKTICEQHAPNFETLRRAFKQGDVCLLECREKATGEIIAVICAMVPDGDGFSFTPFAKFFNGNPYDMLEPPNPNGGFGSMSEKG